MAEADATYRWACNRREFAFEQWVDSKVYTNRITMAPVEERPRERLLANGAQSLGLAELLAILIRSGRTGESALQAGEKIAARFYDRLERLPKAGRGELAGISRAVGETAYCQIMAGIELGRRVAAAIEGPTGKAVALCCSEDAKPGAAVTSRDWPWTQKGKSFMWLPWTPRTR